MRSVAGDPLSDESMLDADQDGLTNFAEQLHGGDPNLADTDGDCITDDLEVAWAQASALNSSMDDIEPNAALTLWDADQDGTNDSEVLGCDLAGVDIQPVDNNGRRSKPAPTKTKTACSTKPTIARRLGVATDAKVARLNNVQTRKTALKTLQEMGPNRSS